MNHNRRLLLTFTLLIGAIALFICILSRAKKIRLAEGLRSRNIELASLAEQLKGKTRLKQALDTRAAATAMRKKDAPPTKEEATWQRSNVLAPELFDDPAYAQLARPVMIGIVLDRYSGLFAKLSLSEDAKRQLQEKFAARIMAGFDVSLALKSMGINPTSQEGRSDAASIYQQCNVKFYQEIENECGHDNATIVANYMRNLPARNLAEAVATRLSYTNDALSPAAVDALMKVLSSSDEGNGAPPPFLLTTDPLTKLTEQARAALSPAQLIAVNEILEEEAAGNERALLAKKLRPAKRPPDSGKASKE